MTKTRNIRILIADSSSHFIKGMRLMLSDNSNFEIVDSCSNINEIINNKNLPNTDILFIDVDMPRLDGIEIAQIIKKQHPQIKIIAIIMFYENIVIKEVIAKGFSGYIKRTEATENLLKIIEKVENNTFTIIDLNSCNPIDNNYLKREEAQYENPL